MDALVVRRGGRESRRAAAPAPPDAPAAGSPFVAALAARPGAVLDLAVAAWVAANLLSTLAGASPRLSLLGEIGQREGLLTTLALAGLYAGARRSHTEPAHARATLSVILACATIAAGYAAVQLAGFDPLAWANVPTYGGMRRAFGTLGNPILLGNLLAASLAAGVARLASGGANIRGLAPALALTAAAIAGTLSRGAWIAATAGVGGALALALAAGAPRAARRAGLALALVAGPAALWGGLRGPIVERLLEGARGEAVSAPARAEIARGALALWRAHLGPGTGPDTFGLAFPFVQPVAFWGTEWLGLPVHAHSAALQALATLGTSGALAGLAWLAALALVLAGSAPAKEPGGDPGERLALGAALLALVVGGAVNAVGPAGAACFVVCSALAAGEGARAAARAAPVARLPALAAGLAVAVVVAVAGARELRALAAAGRARSDLERSTVAATGERGRLCGLAARHAGRALALAPGEDEMARLACDASLALAEAVLARGDSGAAREAAEDGAASAGRALALEPRRASNLQRRANALVMRARLHAPPAAEAASGAAAAALADSADRAFGEARRLAPVDALILVDQARGQLALRRPEQALATARRIVALYPAAATGHALVAAALLSLGRGEEGREALLRARDARWEDGSEPQRRAVEDLLRAIEGGEGAR